MKWKEFFDSLGLNGTKWQWKILKLQERWENFRTGAREHSANAVQQHRLCSKCGALIDHNSNVCPFCGEALEHWRKVQIKRAFGMILPGGLTFSYTLIAINIAVMAAMMLRFGGMSLLKPDMLSLARAGALMPALVAHGEWWRMITYAFIHGGILHILFNMSSLSQVGPISENEIGRARFCVLYFLSAIGGAAADIFWDHQFGSRPLVVGASGAIFGLIGFGLTYNYFYGGPAGRANSRIYLQWAIYAFAFGFFAWGIDNVCHAGGFITGAILGFVIERDLRHGEKFGWLWRTLATIFVIAAIVAFTFAVRGSVFIGQIMKFQ